MTRKVKILATLGPASGTQAAIERLIKAGANGVRLNFSHGDHAGHKAVYNAVRRAAARLGAPLAVVADLQGPKIRVGALDAPVNLKTGDTVQIGGRQAAPGLLPCTYGGLSRDVKPGDRVLIDDGLVELRALRVRGGRVVCKVTHGGTVKSHKGINLPGGAVSAASVTPKDRRDLAFAIGLGVDYIAVSFVRTGRGLRTVRQLIRRLGSDTPVIAKIEKPEALANLDAILAECEGLMVARGDLAVETAPEAVPVYQKDLVKAANAAGKLDIVATQMLDSMTKNLTPTRAEITDVANAVFDGADVVMLSQETAIGDHPPKVVAMMDRIVRRAETSSYFHPHAYVPDPHDQSALNGITHAAGLAADETMAAALVVYSRDGAETFMIANKRPHTPVIAVTPEPRLWRRFSLYYNITPCLGPRLGSVEAVFAGLRRLVRERRLVRKGATVVLLASASDGRYVLRIDKV
ncbi:MAG: pyruvate kinase [Planctomycetota bacterium]